MPFFFIQIPPITVFVVLGRWDLPKIYHFLFHYSWSTSVSLLHSLLYCLPLHDFLVIPETLSPFKLFKICVLKKKKKVHSFLFPVSLWNGVIVNETTPLQRLNSVHSYWWTSLPHLQLYQQPLSAPSVGWCVFGHVKHDTYRSLQFCQGLKIIDHLHYTWLSSVWSSREETCLHKNSSCDTMKA